MTLPTVVTAEDETLYAQLARAFGATAAAGEPSRTATYAGYTWTRIQDNHTVKFVRSGQQSAFEQSYGRGSMPSKQRRISMKENELDIQTFVTAQDRDGEA